MHNGNASEHRRAAQPLMARRAGVAAHLPLRSLPSRRNDLTTRLQSQSDVLQQHQQIAQPQESKKRPTPTIMAISGTKRSDKNNSRLWNGTGGDGDGTGVGTNV